MRGYYGIGIEHPKTIQNIGTLWRSAFCFGASFIFTIGDRYRKQCSDTLNTPKHIPYFRLDNIDQFKRFIPYDCIPVGIELFAESQSLETFSHPERAIYILGPEDGGISREMKNICKYLIKFKSLYCLNVASAGTVIMYDRQTKRDLNDRGTEKEIR